MIVVDTERIVDDRDYALALTRLVLNVLLKGIDLDAICGVPPAESFAIGARSGERHGDDDYVAGLRGATLACETHGFSWSDINDAGQPS